MTVRIHIQPSASMTVRAHSDAYATTVEDLARIDGEILMLAYPHIGEELFWEDGTSYTVKRVSWPIDGTDAAPIVEVDRP